MVMRQAHVISVGNTLESSSGAKFDGVLPFFFTKA